MSSNKELQGGKNNEMLNRKLRIQKRTGSKNGAKGKRARRTVYGSVTCNIHGFEVKGKNGFEVRCPAPKTKRERFSGCPKCPPKRHDNCGYTP